MADNKRFAFIPIGYEDRDRALEGELILDKDTGDVWTKDSKGEVISATSQLEKRVQEIINSGVNSMSHAYNNNRRVYRFYYEHEAVRLDRQLELDSSVIYYRIRDIKDDGKYFVTELTNVKNDATAIFPFINNETYFVEFYNLKREMISQMIFTAKFAPTVLLDGDPDKIISRIELHTNKDFLYVTENPGSLLVRVYAIFEDGSSKDVTTYDNVILNRNIFTDEVGTQTISAVYYYDTINGQYVETEKEIAIVEDAYAKVYDLVVVPRKIVRLNDGTRSIKLVIIAYFEDGSVNDVTDEVVVSENFNDRLFNVEQGITIKFNAGHLNVIEKDYKLLVRDNGSASNDIIFYKDQLFTIDPTYTLDPLSKFYRVRDAEDLSYYYTIGFNEVNFDATYIDKPILSEKISTGSNVIVEFYGENKKLVDSVVFTAQYKGDETNADDIDDTTPSI